MSTVAGGTPGPSRPATRLQHNGLRIFLIVSIVLTVVFAPVAFIAISNAVTSLVNLDSLHDYTGEPKDQIIFTQVLRLALFPLPFLVFLTLSIVLFRRRNRQVFSRNAAHLEKGLSTIGRGITGPVAQGALSLVVFALGLGGLFTLLGLGSMFATQDEIVGEAALGLLMPVDPIMLAWTVPGIVFGLIFYKCDFTFRGFALAGSIVCIVCLVLSITKVGVFLPLLMQGLGQAFNGP